MLVCGARIKINTVKPLLLPRAQGAGPRAHNAGASIQQSQQVPPNLTPLLLSCYPSNQDHPYTDIHGNAHRRQDARVKKRAGKEQNLQAKRVKIHAKEQDSEAKICSGEGKIPVRAVQSLGHQMAYALSRDSQKNFNMD
jgi:hypothetical protein